MEEESLLQQTSTACSSMVSPRVKSESKGDDVRMIHTIRIGSCYIVLINIDLHNVGVVVKEELIVGPDWQGIIATVSLLMLSCTFCFRMLVNSCHTNKSLTPSMESILLILIILTLYAYMKCALGDPGLLRKLRKDHDFFLDAKHDYVCMECDLHRPTDYSHCFECGCCVHMRENHCAWIGKCIGSKTSFCFKVFNVCWVLHFFFFLYIWVRNIYTLKECT